MKNNTMRATIANENRYGIPVNIDRSPASAAIAIAAPINPYTFIDYLSYDIDTHIH